MEVFSNWWHNPEINHQVKPKHRIDETIKHYAKYGFSCTVIWEDELANEELVLSKLSDAPAAMRACAQEWREQKNA